MDAPQNAQAGAQPGSQQGAQANAAKTHLYEAVSNQRERVLGAFDTQRDAIMKAVDEQRLAAMAPIQAQQARQATQGLRPQQLPGAAPQPPTRQSVVADIVVTLKAMVAEEVRAQLLALLAAADARQNAAVRESPPAHAG